MSTVVDLLASSPATIRFDDGSATNGAELVERGRRIAGGLRANGIRAGDRVALHLINGRRYVEALAACAVGRFVAVSVNPRFSEDEAASIIGRSGSRVTITASGPLPEGDPIGDGPTESDRFVVFTTSGTTSAPKLVVHTQGSIARHGRDVAPVFGYDSSSRVLIALPLCGTFGLATLVAALAGGSEIALATGFDPATLAPRIEHEAITSMHGSDDMFHRLLAEGRDLRSIECAGYGRFNTSLDGIVERAEAAGLRLTGLYGMSECQALFSLRDRTAAWAERWRAGGTLTSADAAYRVVEGELQIQGPSLFEGYLADGGDRIDEQLTAQHFDGPWFRTGDLAEPDGDRGFTFLTRMGDVLRLGGFLVAPAEIENVLTEIDGIEAAQVVAVERDSGARPVAFVVASQPIDEAAVINHCHHRLARYKCPVRVVVVDAFPVTDGPNGVKIQRAKLRSRAAELVGETRA